MIGVLVVDDDFMVARVHRRLVERIPGFAVVGEARTGGEALQQVEELRPDLVLLDIYLPDMSGLEVVRRLRAGMGAPRRPAAEEGVGQAVPPTRSHEPDVLVITAARDAETVRSALRGGAVHYIIKPFDSAVLHDRLLHYAQKHQELQQIDAADQAKVDRIFGASSARQRMPKGLTAETAELVRDALRSSTDGLSASECAELTGVSRVSARRYLEFFVESRQAEVRLRYGTTGRPERRYHRLRARARGGGPPPGPARPPPRAPPPPARRAGAPRRPRPGPPPAAHAGRDRPRARRQAAPGAPGRGPGAARARRLAGHARAARSRVAFARVTARAAEREGFEPSDEVDPRHTISSRARSAAPAPLLERVSLAPQICHFPPTSTGTRSPSRVMPVTVISGEPIMKSMWIWLSLVRWR
jgi:response regulator of citrate/malate metabolism